MRNRKLLALSLALVMLFSMVASAANYTVIKGDVLWKIAKENNTTWQKLAEINNLKNPNLILVGQILKLDGNAPPSTATKYTGIGKGFGGDLKVEITLNNDKLTAVKVLSHKETQGIGTAAIDKLPSAMVNANSANVAVVAGATVSSKALISAVKKALAKVTPSTPTEPAPVEPAPVEPAPVEPAPVEPAPVEPTPTEPEPPIAKPTLYKPGTYEGKGTGMFGEVIMSVTFSENKIESIQTVKSNETKKVTTPAFKILPERIIAEQSLMVDMISSSTYASRAILTAVEDAANQAGQDISTLKVPLVKTPKDLIQKTTDVLVIGAGGAGLSAAVAAVQEGAKVIVLEKNEWAGGNTVASGGAWNAPDPALAATLPTKGGQVDALKKFLTYKPEDYGPAAETLRTLQGQIEKYISDGAETMFDSKELYAMQTYIGGTRKDLDGKTIQGDFDLIKILAENSLSTRNWVKDLGAVFKDKLSEPSGALWTRALGPESIKNPTGQIYSYVTIFEDSILKNGGELIYDTPATKLIVENGAVKGAIGTMADGTKVEIRAKSVVMATGGFASNIEMVKEYDNYWGNFSDNIKSTTIPSTVGDGLVMSKEVHAQWVGMDATQLNKGYKTTGMHAAEMGMHAIFVNTQGKRFVNEYAARDVYTKAAIEQGGEYFCIMSEKNRMDKNGIYDTFIFNTIEEMAAKFGMDATVLKNQIDLYNGYVEQGKDPDFKKDVFGDKIEAPYAISNWVPIIHHTMGGLKINTDAAVIDTNGKPISGLFAAGEVTGGLHGGNRLGGNAVADAYVFGRIAGANAAKTIK